MTKIHEISNILLGWYRLHKRELPWRDDRDPYKIWLSEIILQQTRVQQGLPYYWAFIHKFPTIKALASADLAEVYNLWQGLGYYSRANNLHKTAKIIASQYNGLFPHSYPDLLKTAWYRTLYGCRHSIYGFWIKISCDGWQFF